MGEKKKDYKFSSENQPENRHIFNKDNQPPARLKSEGQSRRWKFKKLAQAILDGKPSQDVLDELRKINPDITNKMTRKELLLRSCTRKAVDKGDTKAMVDLLKVSDLYREKAPEEDEREFEGVEYDEL